jgi:hypothetical protein
MGFDSIGVDADLESVEGQPPPTDSEASDAIDFADLDASLGPLSDVDAAVAACEPGVWAVGGGGLVLHNDGSGWQQESTGSASNLRSLWLSPQGSIWAVGTGGEVLRRDGTSWSPLNSGSLDELTTVWGYGDDDVYVGSAAGAILHWDGFVWDTQPLPVAFVPRRILGVGGALYAAGEAANLASLDAGSWTSVASPQPSGVIYALEVRQADLWVGGWNGQVSSGLPGAWTAEVSNTTRPITDIWAPAANEAWAVGYSGAVLQFDGNAWAPLVSGTTNDLQGVWGDGVDVWVVGRNGALRRFDGVDFVNESPTANSLWAIEGRTCSQ